MSKQDVFRKMESYTEGQKADRRRLYQERDDIHLRAFKDPDSRGDQRANPDFSSEDWSLGNQLEHGARLTPHRR